MKGVVLAAVSTLVCASPAMADSWSFDSGHVVADPRDDQAGEVVFDCARSPYASFAPDADLDPFVDRKGVTLVVTAGMGNIHTFPVSADDLGTQFNLNDAGARELAALALVGTGFSAAIQYKGKTYYKSDFESDGLSTVRDKLAACETAGLLVAPDVMTDLAPHLDDASNQE